MARRQIGYIRVSTVDQNPERQLEGMHLSRTFIDKASGKDSKRPQLVELMSFAKQGDVVVVHSIDRLARNLDDLRRLVLNFTERGVWVQFIKESMTFTGEDSPMATFMLSVMGAFAEFERAIIRERQKEGIALAKKRGVYKGRKRALSSNQVEGLLNRVAEGAAKASLAREYGISRETLYKYLKESH